MSSTHRLSRRGFAGGRVIRDLPSFSWHVARSLLLDAALLAGGARRRPFLAMPMQDEAQEALPAPVRAPTRLTPRHALTCCVTCGWHCCLLAARQASADTRFKWLKPPVGNPSFTPYHHRLCRVRHRVAPFARSSRSTSCGTDGGAAAERRGPGHGGRFSTRCPWFSRRPRRGGSWIDYSRLAGGRSARARARHASPHSSRTRSTPSCVPLPASPAPRARF